MSELADLLEKHGGSESFAKSVAAAENIIGVASGAYGYYKTAKDLGKALGLWGGGPSELELLGQAIQQLADAIDKAFAELQQLMGAEFRLQTRQNMAPVTARARSAVATIAAHWDNPAEINVPDLLYDTRSALETLNDDAFWERTFYEETAYRDPWTGPPVWPPGVAAEGDWQWDHVLALPAFLEVLACRVVTLRMLDPDDITSDHKTELLTQAGRLHDIFWKIHGGIRSLRMPTADEARCAELVMPSPSFDLDHRIFRFTFPAWHIRDEDHPSYLYGAFNVWSTESSVQQYPSEPPYPPGAAQSLFNSWTWQGSPDAVQEWRDAYQAWYQDQVADRHALRTLKDWKDVYGQAGIRAVWQVRNQLLRLVGAPVERLPSPSDSWSFAEVTAAIPPERRPPASLRATAAFLGTGHSVRALYDA